MSLWSIILTTTKSLVSNTTDPPRAQTLHLSELPVSPLSKDLYDSAHTYLIRFLPDTSQMIPGSPPGGEALSFRASPCEAELQELMEQIDIMVSNKKLDWERKMRALETRLDLQDQELANAQTCLDQKGQEVGLLRQKLDSLEKCNLVMTQNYEGQLQTLKAQFSKLTNSFERLKLHQMKQNEFQRKELQHPEEEIPFELSNLNQKLEEFRVNSREWDKQEILYQTHLVSSDAQQKLLSEKCKQFQAMEAGLSEVKSELQSRDDLLRITEMERLQLHRELLRMGECQNAQENKKRLESSYSPPPKEPERKKKEVFSVTPDKPNHEKELSKIRSQLYQEEENRSSERERMRHEICDLTEELHQKDVTIATITKKASLLERQLKMELEIKEKMLAKQQVSGMRYKAVRSENTHLKGMMGDLDPGQYMTNEITDIKGMGFTNREHSRHASVNKLEYENERLQNDLAKLHTSVKSAWANQNTCEETGRYAYHSQIKMEKDEDRLSRDRQPNRSTTPLSPPLPFQTKEMTSPLVGDDELFPLKHAQIRIGQPDELSQREHIAVTTTQSPLDISFPASLAAQQFFLEEEKQAKEFERLLNTHIDELQRHTEFTLNKYTKLKHNRHI
ncbi:deuterosome assembly protein 1 isoform X10 [Manis javanica]|uniref:deuterosome assembly protein 1 isoform X10 n=1 Tax=Manis javanica TaxID=9974 RepID=UPI003C6D06DE